MSTLKFTAHNDIKGLCGHGFGVKIFYLRPRREGLWLRLQESPLPLFCLMDRIRCRMGRRTYNSSTHRVLSFDGLVLISTILFLSLQPYGSNLVPAEFACDEMLRVFLSNFAEVRESGFTSPIMSTSRLIPFIPISVWESDPPQYFLPPCSTIVSLVIQTHDPHCTGLGSKNCTSRSPLKNRISELSDHDVNISCYSSLNRAGRSSDRYTSRILFQASR